jgi:transcriptional regulator with PAS, ATPase and Fis domain
MPDQDELAQGHMGTESTSTRKITLAGAPDLFDVPVSQDGPAKRRFALLVFFDSDAQMRLLDEGAQVVVGREAPSEIVVDDPSVSRQHARFTLKDGEVRVEDLDSTNGTFVRGRRIAQERLDAADEVVVGKARIILAATRANAARSEAPIDDGYVVVNPKMRKLYADTRRAARADVPLLILGETGAGKEHVARTFHREGPRADKLFLAVNCAAIPASLIESTLFGHERGAFTGAQARAIGMFERASGGVLFLDEIGDLGSGAQAALLRAIETRRITRVGATTETAIDVRLVAATHCDLEDMVEEGTFREDLFFRLSGIQVVVPPLRERPDEIQPLVHLVLEQARREWTVSVERVAPDALDAIRRYSWPGNVRQLRHAIERAALLSDGASITREDLPPYVFQVELPALPCDDVQAHVELALKPHLRRYERALIDEALKRTAGNRQMAAKLLRIPLRTLFRKLRASGSPNGEKSGVSE